MTIIVVFPKMEDAKNIRNILVRNGFVVTAICTSGAQALSYMDDLQEGIVVCGYRFSDMIYKELKECMPQYFDMLLIASKQYWSECPPQNLMCLALPLKTIDLINTVDLMIQTHTKRKKKQSLTKRSKEDIEQITEAKRILMERNHMSEQEAHRYIQKSSMDSGRNLVETAQMVIQLML